MNLLIVESPKKAKEISHFLGNGWIVRATVGHFKDLPKKEIGFDFKTYTPKFVITDTKHKEVLNQILSFLPKVNEVFIATDPDREGYAIGHMVYEEIKKKFKGNIYRVEFREITKKHIIEQLKTGAVLFEKTNEGYFKAFLGRRVGDRLIGYTLSPKHSNKLSGRYSVGRVQSPAVKLVVDRDNEIKNFKPTPYYVLSVLLNKDNIQFKAIYESEDKTNKDAMEDIYNQIKNIPTAKVDKIEKKKIRRNPKAPFTTSTLQQSANTTLKFAPEKTMQLAQGLFEAGFITYHRTDSTRLSNEAINDIRTLIKDTYGNNYLNDKVRIFKSKHSQAEAHEAIRITEFVNLETQNKLVNSKNLTLDHFKLLKLIYERTIATQMAGALFDRTIATFDISGYKFKTTGNVLVFKGFLAVFNEEQEDEDKKDENNQKLPALKKGDEVNIIEIKNEEKFTKAPPKFSEASLIKKLENLGIGRPSTYASIIKTIKDRGYIKIEKSKLTATPTAFNIIDSLNSDDNYIIDYKFTKDMEDFLDLVEDNKENWKTFIKTLHNKTGGYVPEKRAVKKPSEKQIKFAEALSEQTGLSIPKSALESSYEISKFIDKALKKSKK
jgi:DNA topoisomerase-1